MQRARVDIEEKEISLVDGRTFAENVADTAALKEALLRRSRR